MTAYAVRKKMQFAEPTRSIGYEESRCRSTPRTAESLVNWQGTFLLNFENSSIWLNLLLFAVAAGVIWFAGTTMERLADGIARRTGLGQAFVAWRD